MTDNSTLYDFDPEAQPTSEQTLTVCHINEDYDVYGGRASGGKAMGDTQPPYGGWLGNPYRLSEYGRDECIERFEEAFYDRLRDDKGFCNAVHSLAGRRVACHCRFSNEESPACHLDVVRAAILDGKVARIAHSIHDIPLTEAEKDRMADPEVLL